MKRTLPFAFSYPRPLPGCLLVLAGLCISDPVFAQSDTTKKLEEVKVSSSKIQLAQTASPTQQITATDLNHYSAFDIADAIRNFAGVNIKDYGGIGGLKTISVRGLGANHTTVFYDGMQINDTENGQIDLSKLTLNNVQSITLYNGQPSNIVQTARAFSSASVLAIETTKPNLSIDKSYTIIASMKGGSFGLINPYLQWQQRISNRWSFLLNGDLEKANGRYQYRANDNGAPEDGTRTNADINAKQADAALYWTKNDSNAFSIHLNYYNSDRGLPGVLVDKTIATQRLKNRDLFVQTHYEHSWDSGLRLVLNNKVSKNYLNYLNPSFLNAAGGIDQRFTQRELYQSAALGYSLTANWDVSYAVDVSWSDVDVNSFNFAYPTRFSLLNVLASNLTIGQLHLQGSLLNTHIIEKVKNGSAAPTRDRYSPTLMAAFRPFDGANFQVRGYFKSIFRNPTFNDLYYGGIGNPNLKPELADQYDLGITYGKALNSAFEYVSVTADAYYNKVTNKIVFLPKDAYNGSIQNFGNVDIKGMDIGLKTQVKLSAGWKGTVSINSSYIEALNVTDPTSSIYLNQLPYTPKFTLACNLGLINGPIGIYYDQISSSSRYFTNNNDAADLIPGYAISNASFVYKFTSSHLPMMASVEVNNLFDNNYAIVRSYPMPGRSYRLTFQITI